MKFEAIVKNLLRENEQLEFEFEKPVSTPVDTEEKQEETPFTHTKDSAINDNSIRPFEIKWDFTTHSTMATSKENAISNIAARLAKKNNIKIPLQHHKMKDCKVLDKKWKISY